MAEEAEQISKIQTALHRARRRWLFAAMVNAGGRWAVLPGCAAAMLGIVVALAGGQSLWWFLPLTVIGLAGVLATLAVTRQVYSRPGASGAPDWALLLDRALGLHDTLPAWLEADDRFKPALAGNVAAGLDPVREKAAAPIKRWAAVVVALILALMPLAFWRPDAGVPPVSDNESPIAQEPPLAGGGGGGGEGNGSGGDAGEGEGSGDGPSEGNGGGNGDGDGETPRKPDASGANGGAGEKPDDAQPEAPDDPSRPRESTGDQPETPPDAPPAKPPGEVEEKVESITPDAGEGETRTERRAKWVYNPEGEGLDESTPTPPRLHHDGERALPRSRVKTSERKVIEDLYRKLYD